MAKGDELQARLMSFSVSILKLCDELPKSSSGKHIASQLVRAGTSPVSNYAEARGAESRKDFIHKLGITLKELNESSIWLEMIVRGGLLPAETIDPVLNECVELAKIVNASIATSSGRNKKL
jgi:four helix bundle protein